MTPMLDVMRRIASARGYVAALAAVAVVTAVIGAIEARADIPNVPMLYLVAILGAATLAGRGPAIVASIASFLAFNWFFLAPIHTLTIGDQNEWFALVLFIVTAVITGQLAADQRVRASETAARAREAELMFDIARMLSDPDIDAALARVTGRLRDALGVTAAVVEIDGDGASRRITAGDTTRFAGEALGSLAAWITSVRPEARAAARWIRVVDPRAARTHPRDKRVHAVPLSTDGRRMGTLAVQGDRRPSDADDRILRAVAAQLGSAIERARLRQRATDAEILRRADALKNALLSAVSHDLRTPLATIVASAGSLRQIDVRWTDAERETFLSDIEQEARRLSRIVGNLLDLSRVESGTLHPERGWYDLASLIDDVVGRLRPSRRSHPIEVRVADDLPPVPLDYVEIDQVLSNLIENAIHHTPQGSTIVVVARFERGEAVVEVADDGPGIAMDAMDRLFKPFLRGAGREGSRGTGLGLAVARGLVEAHGGRIAVRNRPEGGALFAFTLPVDHQVTPAGTVR
jgi:two-component system, OmpR family, sensor histidine kinase KdpD